MTNRLLLILLALVVATLAAAPGVAHAAKPCWKVLLNDWYDGRIDNSYPVSCYRAAIKNLPEDVESYSNAREEINRALLNAINKSKREGDPLGPRDPVPAQTGGGVTTEPVGRTSTEPGDTIGEGEGEGEGEEAVPPTGDDGGSDDEGLVGVLKPANAESIPIPLLVLAGLALLLLAAASAGFVARRLQARRAGPPRPPQQ